ncbi:hypothetical protein DEJ50_20525 [Streptomyces venezuelae]|uniref:Uncharacterized protein n=1 Tax=Streptomyces venezuelae TaxID=54571 RepID=A0A5P2D3X0_STRVZ|nr:hypothetical protein [Streptomyces venezuelae]QES49854.1 hypothetical protein DEJ50_20525 [Streptomyces venezuelae]
MSAPDPKERDVRRMLDGPHPAVPPGLASDAAMRGTKLLRRRRRLRRVGWWLLLTAAVAFTVWAILTEPWTPPSQQIAPPLESW